MKKMTDNEIIKALECCYTSYDCEDCPYYCSDKDCPDLLMNALDLINRQKADIERLKKKANTPFAKVTFDENKLKEIVSDVAKNIEFNLNSVKSEAIKEFAHLVIDRSRNGVIYASDIPDLVKEMTEVNEDE